MNKKQWIALLAVYITYLLFGAGVFFIIETKLEEKRRDEKFFLYRNITDYIKIFFPNLDNETEQMQFINNLQDYCGKPVQPDQRKDDVFPIVWDFYNSFFFVVTVVSTIGYGNLSPTSATGRILMIFYAIFGIPLNGILLTQLGQFFSSVFIRAHHKYKQHKHYETKCSLAIDIIIYLIPGIIVFIFLPAGAFMYFEQWTFDVAVYYAFVTLTTIGFGDFVAGQQVRHHNDGVTWTYKVLLLCWIIFGLGYLIMLLGFVTRAMRSKKIVRMEQKLVDSVVRSKFWNGFAKDIGYLRRIINEIHLDKFKPVFKEEPSKPLLRSKSLPNIHICVDKIPDEEYDNIVYKRRRANSEYVPSISRVFSETDLERIDRKATFAPSAMMQRADFLKEVACALEDTLNRTHDEPSRIRGIDVFSDEDVLRSELGNWTIGGEKFPPPPPYENAVRCNYSRDRAASAATIPSTMLLNINEANNAEWTWTGAASNMVHKLHREHKERMSPEGTRKDSSRKSIFSPNKLVNAVRGKKRIYSESTADTTKPAVLSVPGRSAIRKRHSLQPIDVDLSTQGRRDNNHYMTITGAGETSNTSTRRQSLFDMYQSGEQLFGADINVLEETTLADFLRILQTIHARVGNMPEPEQPRRKLGSSSLDASNPPPSLAGLFAPDEPPNKDKRKFSLRNTLFSQPTPVKSPLAEEPDKPESSNLKRLGRFLLRRYSKTAPMEEMPEEDKQPKLSRIRKFSIWPNETYQPFKNDASQTSTSTEPSVKIDIEGEVDEQPSKGPDITITPAPEDENLPAGNFNKARVTNPKWRIHQLRNETGGGRRPSLPNMSRTQPG